MMRESEGLKVYCYAKPHCKHFREEEFGTVAEMVCRWDSSSMQCRSGSVLQSATRN